MEHPVKATSESGSLFARHPLAAFVALSYLISWAWWVPLAASGATVRQGVGWPTQIPGLLGPMVAALVVTWRVDGGDGLRRLWRSIVRWRIGWWWFAVLIVLVAGGAGLWLSSNQITASGLTAYNGIPAGLGALLTVIVVFIGNGFGEEVGWRGIAAARLLHTHSLVATSLIVWLMWAPWHIPLFFLMESFEAFTAVEVVGWVIGLVAGSVLLTWLFRGSGGSVLLVAVWHTAFNFTSATPAAAGAAAALSSMLVMIAALLLVIAELRRRSRPRWRAASVIRMDRPAHS